MDEALTVSQLARRVGVSADTIRYYQRIGLLADAERTPAGYRVFGQDAVERVAFVKRAQAFGLQLEEIRQVLDVRERGLCPCGHARRLLAAKLTAIDEQMTALARLRDDIVGLMAEGLSDAEGCWPCGEQLVTVQPKEREPS